MNVKNNPILAADLVTHETGQFKWRMGVKPLNLNNWLIVDDERGADLHEIRNLIDSHRNQVVYSEPDAASACQELFEEIHFHLKERTGFVNLEVESRSDRPAIESARRIVQEDLCVLQKRPAGWTMTACAVAIPTQWHVPSKFGKTLDDIHGPVPRYGVDLSRPMGIFFDRLRPEKSVWRSNFTLTDDPNLRLIPNRRNHPLLHNVTKDNVADQVLLRVEYQTLDGCQKATQSSLRYGSFDKRSDQWPRTLLPSQAFYEPHSSSPQTSRAIKTALVATPNWLVNGRYRTD